MCPEFVLGITEEQYNEAGSKFITLPFDLATQGQAHVGEVHYRKLECGMLDWDTPGKSMKIPVTITDNVDNGKEDKLSFGVDDKGIWKGKAIYKNISGKEMPMKVGADKKKHPAPNTDDINGKEAVGAYVIIKGTKGGVVGAEPVYYPKLSDILPAGYVAPASKDLGIG